MANELVDRIQGIARKFLDVREPLDSLYLVEPTVDLDEPVPRLDLHVVPVTLKRPDARYRIFLDDDLQPCSHGHILFREPMERSIWRDLPACSVKVALLAREPARGDPDERNEIETLRELEETALPLLVRNKAEDPEAVEGCLEEPTVAFLSTAGFIRCPVHGELSLDCTWMPAREWLGAAIDLEEEEGALVLSFEGEYAVRDQQSLAPWY